MQQIIFHKKNVKKINFIYEFKKRNKNEKQIKLKNWFWLSVVQIFRQIDWF